MHLAVGNANEGGDVGAQVESAVADVHLYRALVLAEPGHGNTERQRSIVVESSAYSA
jgi:hypothetical protein